MELSNKERYEIKRQEKETELATRQRKAQFKKILKWALTALVFFGALYGVFLYFKNKPVSNDVTSQCVVHGPLGMHIHPALKIVILGRSEAIPANVGIPSPQCMHPLHTHDATGVVHIESKEIRDFYLKEFFAVWGKTFNRDQILDYKTDAAHRLRITVNGKETGEFENLIMRDKDEIVIYYEKIK